MSVSVFSDRITDFERVTVAIRAREKFITKRNLVASCATAERQALLSQENATLQHSGSTEFQTHNSD